MTGKGLKWGRGPTPPGATIPQAMLAAYAAIAEQERQLRRARGNLRLWLLDRVAAGVPVEQGPLAVEVREDEERRLTVENLSAVIGADNVAVFREAIERTVVTRLEVREAQGRADSGPAGRAGRTGRTSGGPAGSLGF